MNRPSLWKTLTSLRLTVACLAIGIALVFFGTLAQVNEGLWNAQGRWFRSFFVVRHAGDAWWVPPVFPGGYLLGIVLLLNLVAAHLKRFQWSTKKIGIHLTHLGVVTLLVGQLATDMLSVESHMRFREGETHSYSEAPRINELVFATDSAPGQEDVVSFPDAIVRQKGELAHPKLPFTARVKEYAPNSEVLSHTGVVSAGGKLAGALATVDGEYASAAGLETQAARADSAEGRAQVWRDALKAVGESDTKDIVAAAKRVAAQPEREGKLREELKRHFKAGMIERFTQQGGAMRYAAQKLGAGEQILAEKLPAASSAGAGRSTMTITLPEAKDMDTLNMPFVVVELNAGGQSLGTWLLSPWLEAQEIAIGDKTYRAAFRPERYYYPFSITLLKTTHEVYPGTVTAMNPEGIPKNFQSRVRVTNSQANENREVDIYMNNPLRYAGLTFYQYQMGRDEMTSGVPTSTLQVVRNPGWLTPYFGCLIVGAGMLWQFLAHLFSFINKRKQPAAAPDKKSARNRGESLAKV